MSISPITGSWDVTTSGDWDVTLLLTRHWHNVGPESTTPAQHYADIGSTSQVCTSVHTFQGGGPRVVISTAAFHARVRGSFAGLGGLKETKMFLPHPLVKLSIVGSLRDREVACSASDRRGLNLESCVWRAVSSHSSHHPQEVLLAQFSLHGAQKWPKARFISFHFTHILFRLLVWILFIWICT